jgi:RimJ/RimL family protein N-acetyltransferase
MYELNKEDYDKVSHMFAPMDYLLFCPAVLEGVSPGHVYVDDIEEPRSAMVHARVSWCYLAGDPHNQAFNAWLKSAILEHKIAPDDAFGLLFYTHPGAWAEQLDQMLAPQEMIHATRRHYSIQSIDYDWHSAIPEGFTLQPIDESLLSHDEINDDVRTLILANQGVGTPGGKLGKGIGYVALHDRKVVAHSAIDVIVGDRGEIGLVTQPEFRRRGLATITSGAAIEYGLANGLSTVYWDCDAGNNASLRTAEKLGFTFEFEHPQYIYINDPVRAMINRAWRDMETGEYAGTIEDCNWLIENDDGGLSHAHYLSAAAHAGLGDKESAIEHLNAAWTAGWDNNWFDLEREEFDSLRDRKEWDALSQQIQDRDN